MSAIAVPARGVLSLPQFAPGTLTALKWFALVLMVLDHVDAAFFDRQLLWPTQLGRLVFPIFAAIVAINLARPGAIARGVHARMLRRLLVFGLLAEPFHAQLLAWSGFWPLNILVTFAAFVAITWLIERGELVLAGAAFLVAGALVEFNWPGLAVCLAIWRLYRYPASVEAVAIVVAAVASLGILNGSQAALWALPVLVLASRLVLQLPRSQWAFYAFYPAHLAAIVCLVSIG